MQSSHDFKSLEKLLDERMDKIQHALAQDNQPIEFKQQMQDLWYFLQTNNSPGGRYYDVYEEFEKSDFFRNSRGLFSDAQNIYETQIEMEDVLECLNSPLPETLDLDLLKQLISNNYDQETLVSSNREFDAILEVRGAAGIPGTFMMVGCGPLAQTLVHFGLTYGASFCLGIDNNARAVEHFNKLRGYFKFKNINCELVDGTRYNYAGHEVIFVANFASPKPAILQRIAETAISSSIVAFRLPVRYSSLFYDSVDYRSIRQFEVVKELTVNNKMMNRTVIVRKIS